MMREDLRIPLTMLSISFLNKQNFKGSYNGKRFMFEKTIDKDDDNKPVAGSEKLKVYVWKDLLNFENTKLDDMKINTFDYTKDGIEKGIDFVESTKV